MSKIRTITTEIEALLDAEVDYTIDTLTSEVRFYITTPSGDGYDEFSGSYTIKETQEDPEGVIDSLLEARERMMQL